MVLLGVALKKGVRQPGRPSSAQAHRAALPGRQLSLIDYRGAAAAPRDRYPEHPELAPGHGTAFGRHGALLLQGAFDASPLLSAALLLSTSCTLTLDYNQCETNQDCVAKNSTPATPYCTSDKICVTDLPVELLCDEAHIPGSPSTASAASAPC